MLKNSAPASLLTSQVMLYIVGNTVAGFALSLFFATINWDILDKTDSMRALGFVGLVQVVPILALVFVSGLVVDRYPKKTVLLLSCFSIVATCFLMTCLSWLKLPVWWSYLVLFLFGVSRAFFAPSKTAYLFEIIDNENRPKVLSIVSSLGQLAGALGAGISGVAIYLLSRWNGSYQGISVAPLYLIAGLCYLVFFFCMTAIKKPRGEQAPTSQLSIFRWSDFFSGASYLRSHPILLSALLLDLLAVLFGGVTALLSVYAYKILHAGPIGYGLLRAATPIGAMIMAYWHVKHPPTHHPGKKLIFSVLGFGVLTILFGYSKSLILSICLLFGLGILDNVSVVVRSLLLSFYTQQTMRGRVLAISHLFVNMSNELGELESGELAHHIGPIGSVVVGGILSIICTIGVSFGFPQLFKLTKLETSDQIGSS